MVGMGVLVISVNKEINYLVNLHRTIQTHKTLRSANLAETRTQITARTVLLVLLKQNCHRK